MTSSPTEQIPPESSDTATGSGDAEPPGASAPPATSALIQVTLPELGPDVLEAVVVAWERHLGDWVEQDEPICIVDAHDLRAAVASSASGRLVRLLAGVGTRLEPGASLAEIEMDLKVTQPTVEEDPEPEADPEPEPEPDPEPELEPEPEPEPDFNPLAHPVTAPRPEPEPVDMARFHSPAVKRLAARHQLDLTAMTGTGIGGRIRQEDVLAYLGGGRGAP